MTIDETETIMDEARIAKAFFAALDAGRPARAVEIHRRMRAVRGVRPEGPLIPIGATAVTALRIMPMTTEGQVALQAVG